MIEKYVFEFNKDFINRVALEDKFIKVPERLFHNYDPTNQFVARVDAQCVQSVCSNIEYAGMDDFPNDLWQKWEQLGLGKIKRIMIGIMLEDCK